MRHSKRGQRGITWVELMLAVGLLSVLGIGLAAFLWSSGDARELDAAVTSAQRIREAGLKWRADNQRGCPTLSQLQHERKLASEARTDDPWGQRYRVDCRADDIVVVSPGRDGKLGTEDDVRVPKT